MLFIFELRNKLVSTIIFHELNIKSNLLKRRSLKKFLISLFHSESFQVKRIDIILCTDEYLLSLNKDHLNHDYYTDTLSFLLSNPDELLIGEVYISIPRIRENAKQYNCSFQEELIRVIIHGCLHLCGYKDHPKSQSFKMEAVQEKYLQRWKVSRET